jgi:hypothetical protein
MKKAQRDLIRDYNNFVEREWEKIIPNVFFEECFKPPYNSPFGFIFDNCDKKTLKPTTKNLQPWLSILELAILWLSSVHIIIDDTRKKRITETY